MIERISVDPKIHFGKPCVAGTRITVKNVLELIDEGPSFAQIIQDYYPDLTVEDIRACVQYAIALVASEDIHLTAAYCISACCLQYKNLSIMSLVKFC